MNSQSTQKNTSVRIETSSIASKVNVVNYGSLEAEAVQDIERYGFKKSPSLSDRFVSPAVEKLHVMLQKDARDSENPGYTIIGMIRRFVYDPILMNQTWNQSAGRAILLGVCIGVLVGSWKLLIETGLDLIWADLPERLSDYEWFSESFFKYTYMPLVMSLGCGIAGLAFEKFDDLPDQNQLIDDLMECGRTAVHAPLRVVLFATIAMWAGLPLGPELPLLIVSAMLGSWVSSLCHLDKKQSTTMFYASQAAAIGGFFQYPLGGAFFVLELPHRTGITSAPDIGPCLLASIVSTVVSCAITNSPIAQLFNFGDIPTTLSCVMLVVTVLFSMLGTGVGVGYAKMVKKIKIAAHHQLEAPIYVTINESFFTLPYLLQFLKYSAVGLVCAIACTIFPTCFSWGEAQMQALVDGGNSSLPFFEAHSMILNKDIALCLPSDGLSIGCLVAIPIVKMILIALVLATGIRCGHFWGPAFVAVVAVKLVLSLLALVCSASTVSSIGTLVVIAFMASVHVVTFRSPLGITFIVAQSMGCSVTSIVLALLAAHVAFYCANDTVFYKAQRDAFLETKSPSMCKSIVLDDPIHVV